MAVDPLEHLRAVPLFSQLDDDALARVGRCASVVDVREGMLLTERGQPGSGLYVILDGIARVDLRDQTIELGPGQVVGELGILTDAGARAARVSAATPMRCLAISRDDFAGLLEQEPRIAVPLLRTVAERLRGMIEH